MKTALLWTWMLASSVAAFAAAEEPVDSRFESTVPDPTMGDWQGAGGLVAQVLPTAAGQYRAHLFHAFDEPDAKPVAVLKGTAAALSGDGWSGMIAAGRFKARKGGESIDLQRVIRAAPTLGASPPSGAIVLFDGKNLEAWAKKKGRAWLTEDGPARWKILSVGVLEVVPGADGIITHRMFGSGHFHVEFRTLGYPSNSGVYLETRYEVNINETYGRLDENPNAGFDNCTDDAHPRIRPCRPPLEWQVLDIDFQAPRFDARGNKTENARATVFFNGVKIYDHQPLNRPKGAAGRLGEAPTGPLMLQEHGMAVQFRNLWFVPAGE